MVMFGVDPLKTINSLRGLPMYLDDLRTLKKQQSRSNNLFSYGKPYPCLNDRFAESGSGKGHYFHQDLLVARRICSHKPVLHVDVGSRIDGFVAHVASFRPILVYDIRSLSNNIPNVTFVQADLMGEIPNHLTQSCDSLSCLHAIEHFGLGRYGDPIRSDGYLLGLDNLYRILKKNGKFYFSVPIGPQRIEFNAQRIFCVKYLLELFSDKFIIDCFSFVDDKGDLYEHVDFTVKSIESNFGCTYGCGIFELTKL
ncbi:MAG: DUF268 domain-containing protein [Desulfobacteraceae bacterium]|nr:DUF268 domain-containing protein [Desulfobacteraceae bacterium]